MYYTTQFLTVNGLELGVTDFQRDTEDLDQWGRGGGLTFEGTTYAQKSSWGFETAPLLPGEADAINGWVKGVGHHWNFDLVDGATTRFTAYSADSGMDWFATTTGYTASSEAKFGRWGMMLHSSAQVTVTATFGIEQPGLSISGWKKIGAADWELCSLVYDGHTSRYFVGTEITTSFAWLITARTVKYFRNTLEGQDGAGSGATSLYDGWMILPYPLSTPQLAARAARTAAEPNFPYVAISGKNLRRQDETVCKGFVTRRNPVRATIDGTYYSNAETLEGTLTEK